MSASSDPKVMYIVATLFGGVALVVGLVVLGVIPAPHFGPEPVLVVPVVQPETPLVLHYGDAQGMYLVPVQASPASNDDPLVWAKAVFEKLRTPARDGLVAGVAPDHKLLDAAFAGDRWTLSVEVGTPPGSTTERLLVGALVRTFVGSWPGAKDVQLKLVDAQGKSLPSQHLDLTTALTPADVVNTAAAGETVSAVKSTIWWPTKQGGSLVPVQLDLKGATGIPPRDAFERLLQGPPAEAASFLASAVPAGAKPSWQTLEAGGVAVIDLTGDLPADDRGRRFIEAAVLTLTEFPDVKAVRFTRVGKPLARIVGPFHLDAPVARPAAPNGAAKAAGGRP